MKSFKEFLLESNIDEELNNAEETIFSIMEDGGLIEEGESFEDIGDDLLAELRENINVLNEKKVDGVEEGWGTEVYVNLDFPQLSKEEETLTEKEKNVNGEKKKEMSNTLKTILDRKNLDVDDDLTKVKFRNEQYKLNDDGKTILKRDFASKSYKPLSDEEIEALLNQRNKNPYSSNVGLYDFDEDNNLTYRKGDDSKIVSSKSTKQRFLKKINSVVNDEKTHYKFMDKSSSDNGKMLINTSYWVPDGEEENIRDNRRFDKAKYKDVESEEEKQKVLEIVNAAALKKLEKGTDSTGKKLKKELGYSNGRFTLDGEEMTTDELNKLVIAINGNVGGDTKLINAKGWGKKTEKYWESYKISVAGSKVGDAINFNLPPGETCHNDVPCLTEGCYAIKAYAVYPAARSAMDCNYALLKRDNGFKLFKKSMLLALSTPKREKDGKEGKKFDLCRIHVNGDFYSTDYLGALAYIAQKSKHVKFWMYTKQYELLAEYLNLSKKDEESILNKSKELKTLYNKIKELKNTINSISDVNKKDELYKQYNELSLNYSNVYADYIDNMENESGVSMKYPPLPSNLCIIVSCWGKFNPFDYANGKYSDLVSYFPLAYLDDGSEESMKLNIRIQEKLGKPKDIQECPCTSNEEIITRCEECGICFNKKEDLREKNLVFRKH